jgi:hypothetical protein
MSKRSNISDEFFFESLELEKEWRLSQPKLTDKQWLDIFPEARDMIVVKLTEYQAEKENLAQQVRSKLISIQNYDEVTYYWLRTWIKATDGPRLSELESHIIRLKRLLYRNQQDNKNSITIDTLELARALPIEQLLDSPPLRKSGRTLSALCPFHQDKSPSFFIYSDQNRWWCYGCNQGGDAITFVRLSQGLSFKEAVNYLVGEIS